MKPVSFISLLLTLLLLCACGKGGTGDDTAGDGGTGGPTSAVTAAEGDVTAPDGDETVSDGDETVSDGDITMPTEESIGETFILNHNSDGMLSSSLYPVFRWRKSSSAVSYTVVLEEKQGEDYRTVLRIGGISRNEYDPRIMLKESTDYRFSVYSLSDNELSLMKGFPVTFMTTIDTADHPANRGLDFSFDRVISENVLCNYLSRSVIDSFLTTGSETVWKNHLRFFLYTGAKYVGRAAGAWTPGNWEVAQLQSFADFIAKAHESDPDIIFEYCIFECVGKKDINEMPIPAWVFDAFGLPAEERCFSYEDMIFTDHRYEHQWGTDLSVPDITRRETQLFFYYRAVCAIDAGFEGIHWGQVELIGENDRDNACYAGLFARVRAYAAEHARRGMVLFNAHTHGKISPDGVLLFDFHAFPSRLYVAGGAEPHIATEDNPQEASFRSNYLDGMYLSSLGGTTYSGWECDSLPYFVELDNWSGKEDRIKDTPQNKYAPWGYDEISWFANQPHEYQVSWLSYAYNWVKDLPDNGFFEMPGLRTAWINAENRQRDFSALSPEYDSTGAGLEDVIRSIWVASNS